MKRGYIVLISGAAIFVAGIVLTVIWALPIAEQIRTVSLNLNSEESQTASLQVENTVDQITVLLSASNKAQINVMLIDPQGRPGINSTFTEATALEVEPTGVGTYRLVVTNQSDSPTSVDIVFGQIPGERTDIDIGEFSGVIAGSAMVVAGIIVMIVGVVIVVIDRRRGD